LGHGVEYVVINWRKYFDDTLNRFDKVPDLDGQTLCDSMYRGKLCIAPH